MIQVSLNLIWLLILDEVLSVWEMEQELSSEWQRLEENGQTALS